MEAILPDVRPELPSPVAIELQAIQNDAGAALTPPYQGTYLRRNFRKPNPFFDDAVRHVPQRGDIVAQLWTLEAANAFGKVEVGLRRDFTAPGSGPYRVVVQVDAGPITRVRAAVPFVRSFIPGRGGAYGSVAPYRTSHVVYPVELVKDQLYSLFVVGGVAIANRPGFPPSYGEVIAAFPRISLLPKVAGLAPDDDAFLADLADALKSHDSPTSAAASLSAHLGDGELVLE